MEYPHFQYFSIGNTSSIRVQFPGSYVSWSRSVPPFISHETPIWKGSHNPILRELTITMVINHWTKSWDDPPNTLLFVELWTTNSSSLRHSEPSEELDVPEEDGISHIFSCAPWEVQGLIPTKCHPTPTKLRRYVDHQNRPIKHQTSGAMLDV